mmetsp:Transcript_25272/g.30565  ORF Transcript_25272/g.30565 Transcript_25272/m.30565 type:complete len:212 (+) Transcript_25272:94-729(+)
MASRVTNPRLLNTLIKSTATSPRLRAPTVVATSIRHYRGDSGEMTPRNKISSIDDKISKREEKLASIAKNKADEIFARHVRLPTTDSISADAMGGISGATTDDVALDIRKKRLIYRCKQRGWLEVDLLLGTWASQNVPGLSVSELDEFEDFVNMETIDIYNVLTLRTEVPEELKQGEHDIVTRVQDWAKKSPLGKANPDMYEKIKRENNLI